VHSSGLEPWTQCNYGGNGLLPPTDRILALTIFDGC